MALDRFPEFLRGPGPIFGVVSEKKTFEEFLYVRTVQEAPFPPEP